MARMSDHTLVLVDGSSYLYRAYHALPDLRAPDGLPTGAVHGMVGMMRWLRDRYPSGHAACVFDAKGKTFRDDWYPQYKATRAPMPDDLARQIEPIHEVVRLLGQGKTTPEIAVLLGLSERTVEFHRAGARRALGITTEWGLVRFAIMARLGNPGPAAPRSPPVAGPS